MVSRDPLANRALVAEGLAVTLVPQLLARNSPAGAAADRGAGPRRDVYALLPPGGRHPHAEDGARRCVEVASELA